MSRLERSIYRDMRDMYYGAETALDGSDMDLLARRLCCRTPEEIEALQFVLAECFERDAQGFYVNAKIEQELAEFRKQQAERSVVKSNENTRQARSRARRAAMFSALREVGIVPPATTKMAELAHMCAEHGLSVTDDDAVTSHVAGHSVTRHGYDTGIQKPEPKPNTPPNPPAGGVVDAEAVAAELLALFPEQRQTRASEVAEAITALTGEGVAASVLIAAAQAQKAKLHRDDGKRCPSVLRWLRERRWLDPAAAPAARDAPPQDWWHTLDGIKAKGSALGLPYDQRALGNGWTDDELRAHHAAYRARVFELAGDGPWRPRAEA